MDETKKFLIEQFSTEMSFEQAEATAAVNTNQSVAWAKFVLTDDKPNNNKQRIPIEEYDNLITTGILMPIKMAQQNPAGNHPDSRPIGVIANLKKEGNLILGLAALWEKENPEDVRLLREMYGAGKPLQLSWEIMYADSTDEDGVQCLKDTALRSTVIVGNPAYAGRTPIIALAEDNTVTEETTLEELDILKTKVAELEALLVTKDAEIATAKTALAELDELKSYKANAEKLVADAQKLETIKTKFSEAGLSKDAEYFTANKERLLTLEESEIDFMLQEFVSFASLAKKETESVASVTVPAIVSEGKPFTDMKELAEALRNRAK